MRGHVVERTIIGEAAGGLFPGLPELAVIHRDLVTHRGTTLVAMSPAAGAILRWLLAADPVAQLIVATLRELGRAAHMPTLAGAALARDKAQAMTIFFNPETIDTIMDSRGAIDWELVKPQRYRSTTFLQYKSFLKHAGLIAPLRLGGSSIKNYNPAADLWEPGLH